MIIKSNAPYDGKSPYLKTKELPMYVQEANRQFFHVLGLHLCEASPGLMVLVDARDEDEGIFVQSGELSKAFINQLRIERRIRAARRRKMLHFVIQQPFRVNYNSKKGKPHGQTNSEHRSRPGERGIQGLRGRPRGERPDGHRTTGQRGTSGPRREVGGGQGQARSVR